MTVDRDNMEEKLNELVEFSRTSGKIDMKLYTEYDVCLLYTSCSGSTSFVFQISEKMNHKRECRSGSTADTGKEIRIL